MPKNKPTLDAKAWKRIWEKYDEWYIARRDEYSCFDINGINAFEKIKRIVNTELRRIADAKEKEDRINNKIGYRRVIRKLRQNHEESNAK